MYIMYLIILPQVTYSVFARMSNWVPINYLVNPIHLLRANYDRFRCDTGEVYIHVNEALYTMEVSAIGGFHLTSSFSKT